MLVCRFSLFPPPSSASSLVLDIQVFCFVLLRLLPACQRFYSSERVVRLLVSSLRAPVWQFVAHVVPCSLKTTSRHHNHSSSPSIRLFLCAPHPTQKRRASHATALNVSSSSHSLPTSVAGTNHCTEASSSHRGRRQSPHACLLLKSINRPAATGRLSSFDV